MLKQAHHPICQLKNWGCYCETGLLETHISLCENNLIKKDTLRGDGGLKWI